MAALFVVPAVLIYFQPNVSMLIILCIVFAIMLFIGGASLSQLGIAALIGGAAIGVLLFAASYRESRITAWLDPWGNKSDAGYQIVQSLYAFGNGGWFGQGLDASRQKLLFLPYRESDFILSIIAEELGFVTVALLIAAYCFIIYRGIRIALSVRDRFASLVAAGFSSILAVQVAVNVAVVTNSIPATGQRSLHQLRRYLACYIPLPASAYCSIFHAIRNPENHAENHMENTKTETAAAITNLSTAACIPETVLRTLQAIPYTVPAVGRNTARKVPHGVESRRAGYRAAAPARGISHEEKRRRQNRRDISVRSEFFFLSHCLGFAAIQPTALPALTRSLFPEAGNTVPNR